MNKPTQIVIVVVMLIGMFVLGLLIPSQFNDKAITDDTKNKVENQKKEKQQKQEEEAERKANLPQNLSNKEFNNKFNEQSALGREFVTNYYKYSFKDPEKNFKTALNFVDEDYQKERDLSIDETDSLMYREPNVKEVTPVQDSSNEDEITFKYDVDLKETFSKDGFDKDKAKKDKKYLKKVKTSDSNMNKDITVTFSLKDNKIIDLKSNYL